MARRKMTKAHKEAIAQGRIEGNAVKAYLDGLGAKSGRNSDPRAISARLEKAKTAWANEPNALKRLELTQTKLDLERALQTASRSDNRASVEKDFIKHAKAFADRKGISYGAFRSSGVPADVLQRAGIKRTRSS